MLRSLLWFLMVGLALAFLVAGTGHLFLALGAASTVRVPVTERDPQHALGTHRIEMWPAERPRVFQESPQWAAMVARGQLPPVADRLPRRPLIVVPPQERGPYGGTMARYCSGVGENLHVEVEWYLNYTGLVRWDPSGTKVLPELAESFEVSPDARTFTFRLREGLRWSDGAPFTSDDIRFWWDDIVARSELSVPAVFLEQAGAKLQTPDPLTVRFVFDRPAGLLLERMAFDIWATDMVSAPKHYLSRFHPRYQPVAELDRAARAEGFGTWSDRFRSKISWRSTEIPRMWAWVMHTPPPATTVELRRNPYYWKVDPDGRQLPYIDRVTFSLTEADSIVLKLIRGDAAFQERYLRLKDYSILMAHQQHGGYRVRHYLGAAVTGVVLNRAHREPAMRTMMDDGRLAKALSVAIDREELVRLFTFGAGKPMQPVPNPNSPYYDAELAKRDLAFDLPLANQLLDELGCRRGPGGIRVRPDGQPLRLQLDLCAPDLAEVGQVIVQQWARAGVDADLRLMARELYYNRKDAGNFDALLDVVGGNEINPLLDARAYVPSAPEASWAGGFTAWFRTDGAKGERPPEDLLASNADWKIIESTADPEIRRTRFAAILRRSAERRACIGLYTQGAPFLVVRDDCVNVPQVAASGWTFRGPGCLAPECFALDPKARRRE